MILTFKTKRDTNGNTYYLYTPPFTVSVGVTEEETTLPPTEETTAPEGSDTASVAGSDTAAPTESAEATETAPAENGGCGSVVGFPALAVAILIPAALLPAIKKRDV